MIFVFNYRTLLIGTGLSKPYIPPFNGSEYTEGYEDISVDPEDFEGQTVLILGKCHSYTGSNRKLGNVVYWSAVVVDK